MSHPQAVGAIDIGGTKIAIGIVDAMGQILAQGETPTYPESGYEAALERTSSILRSLLDETGHRIAGIGVGSPGPIDPVTGIYGEVGTLPGWRGAPIGTDLERRFGARAAIENDADAGAVGEARWGAGRGSKNLIWVTVSTGIGVGLLLDGHVYRGAGGAHPEIGHMIIDASANTGQAACYCGSHGCWETLASGTALESWTSAQSGQKRTAAEICERARRGEPMAAEALHREAHYLGLGLANLVTLFCPETIVLAGGLMQSADLLLEPALSVVRSTVTQVPLDNTSIVLAGLGRYSGLLGAAAAWFHRFGECTGSGNS